eukprot:1534389-Pleurochrysis_carterae.AAC.1
MQFVRQTQLVRQMTRGVGSGTGMRAGLKELKRERIRGVRPGRQHTLKVEQTNDRRRRAGMGRGRKGRGRDARGE